MDPTIFAPSTIDETGPLRSRTMATGAVSTPIRHTCCPATVARTGVTVIVNTCDPRFTVSATGFPPRRCVSS